MIANIVDVDELLKAIAETKRRDIIRLVWARELPAAEIAEYFPDVTRSAISQHLGVLKSNGIVHERREGTRRLYSVNRGEIVKLRAFLDSFWSDGLERLRDLGEGAQPVVTTATSDETTNDDLGVDESPRRLAPARAEA